MQGRAHAGRTDREHLSRQSRRSPRFFWSKVEPFIGDALGYLELTVEGRQWTANLYCNVFEIEHGRRRMGLTTNDNQRECDSDPISPSGPS